MMLLKKESNVIELISTTKTTTTTTNSFTITTTIIITTIIQLLYTHTETWKHQLYRCMYYNIRHENRKTGALFLFSLLPCIIYIYI